MTDKITLTDLVNLQNETTAVNAINNNNAVLTTALDNTLSRNGTQPNTMGANLDMNSNRILNLPVAASQDEPLRLADISTFTQFQNSVNLAAALATAAADATAASGSATAAATSATSSATSATASSTSATASAASATAAATAIAGILKPESYGAVGDGVTDDHTALQNWANALRDGGYGVLSSTAGYATSSTITFTPSTNTAPVTGPRIYGNLKLIGHASLPVNNDLLHIYNPTATTTSQNFYSPHFDSIEVSNTTGTGCGVSIRGFWGTIGRITGTGVQDVVVFPNFLFSGIPDEYESMCNIGDLTGISYRGYVLNNLIGIGASITAGNIRGSIASITAGLGCINCTGSASFRGCIAYTGEGPAVTIAYPPTPAIQATPHEVFMEGWGDIDLAQYGFRIQSIQIATISGHRMNVEAPGTGGVGPSWPLTGYSFGNAGTGLISNVTVNAYITIRPGVTSSNIGTIFDFTNEPNIANLRLNVTVSDQVGFWTGLPASTRYKNIHASASLKIVENGVLVLNQGSLA